jgi:glycosyltransferase involved in cell wall biosynthesis
MNGKPRLLMIVPFLEVGGADKFNLDVTRLLVEQHGWDVTIVATLRGAHRWEERFARLTSDIVILDRLARVQEFPGRIDSIIESRRPDAVLITHSQLGYQLLPWLHYRYPRTPFVDYLHIDADDWKNGGYPRFSLNYQPWLARTLTSSEYLRNRMIAWGADAAKIQVVTTNIDAEEWDPARFDRAEALARFGVPKGLPLILFSGRLDPQKQPQVLAETLGRLRQQGARFHCLIAGDGPEREALELDLAKRGLTDRVRILGFLAPEAVRELLAAAEIFFLPSKWEGVSLAIYEAMAMETAVVAADVGGQRELVTPECGILVAADERQAESYAAHLSALLADEGRRARMATAARRRVREHFRLSAMGAAVAAALRTPAAPTPCAAEYARIHAIEIAEQTRLEWACDEMWRALSDLRAVRAKLEEHLSPKAHSAVVAGLLLCRGTGFSGWVRTLALALGPRGLAVKMKNLRLLIRVLSNHAAADRLYRTFDPDWYRRRHADIRASRVQPLIHYAVAGFREPGRSPHPDLDPASRCAPETGPALNPLLTSALAGSAAHAERI